MKLKFCSCLPAVCFLFFSFTADAQQGPRIIPVVFHILHQYGVENISDAQVQDAMAILNEDFRKKNADTSTVIPPYKPLIADCNIEFRLATKDPNGNCTNGIEHLFTYKTNNANDSSKINQWPRDKYLNIWVVNSINATGSNDAAGYTYIPMYVTGSAYKYDGVMILHDYLGSIGTSNPSARHVITHEVGHYLGLLHPGINCNDGDGISDTPPTGSLRPCNATPPNYPEWRVCDTAVIENVQNFMEYSFCSAMFTLGQAAFINQTLNASVASRNNLWTMANLLATGTDSLSQANPPVCTPVADFHANKYYLCQGGTVTFYDDSWKAPVVSRVWTFANGIPSTSTLANPTVTFNTWGWQVVTLAVSNNSGSDTKTINNYIFVSPPWYDYWATFTEGFESNASNNMWIKENQQNIGNTWQITGTASYNGTNSVMLNDIGMSEGVRDAMISPSVNLSACSNMSFNFKYACATRAGSAAEITESLKIYISYDCGESWTLRRAITGTSLVNSGLYSSLFIPTQQSQWSGVSVALTPSDMQPNVRFKIEFISGKYSNAIYIDDINLQGTLGVNEINDYSFNLNVFPNPSGANEETTIKYTLPAAGKIFLSLTDLPGRELMSREMNQPAGNNSVTLDEKLNAGIYFVKLRNENHYEIKRLVITN